MSFTAIDVSSSDDNDSSFEIIGSQSKSQSQSIEPLEQLGSLALTDDSNHAVRKSTSEAAAVASEVSGCEFESESKLDSHQTQAAAVHHQVDAKDLKTSEQDIQPLLENLPGTWCPVKHNSFEKNLLNFELKATGQIRVAEYSPEGQLVGSRYAHSGCSSKRGVHDYIADERWVTLLSANESGIGCKGLIETWIANGQLMISFVSKGVCLTNVYEKAREDWKPLSEVEKGVDEEEEAKLPILQEISGCWKLVSIQIPAFQNLSALSCDPYYTCSKITINAHPNGADIYNFNSVDECTYSRTAKIIDKEAAIRDKEEISDYIENNKWTTLGRGRGGKLVTWLKKGKLFIAVESWNQDFTLVYERTHLIRSYSEMSNHCLGAFFLGIVLVLVLVASFMDMKGKNA